MQRNSATYIVGFCAVVCVACSLVVCIAAVGLQPIQERNRIFDQQKKVLGVAGLIDSDGSPTQEEVSKIFEEKIEPAYIDMESGELKTVEEVGIPAADYDRKRLANASDTGMRAPQNRARVGRIPRHTLIYRVTNADGGVDKVILPIEGYGLWGTLYGYLAVENDGQTIAGITYYQHIETPGLGGEVDNDRWKSLWPGRKIFGDGGDVQISVIKGPAPPPAEAPYKVDGLSGATLTSNGVTAMLEFWLGDDGFGPYLKSLEAANT